MRSDPFYDRIERDIENVGQSLMAIFPTAEDPGDPFIYTIGNHEKGLPELLIVGACDQSFGQLLNHLGRLQRERERGFEHNEIIDVGGQVPLKAIATRPEAREEYAIQAGRYYEVLDFEVVQILIPDPQGRFPDDPNCEPPYNKAPVLSRSKPH